MAEQENGETKKTILIALALLVIAAVIGVREFYLKTELDFPILPNLLPAVRINYDVLKSDQLNNLKPFEEILLPEEVGRENPFESISN